jgi:glycosyltransferase involved in cell wall biosynthesis
MRVLIMRPLINKGGAPRVILQLVQGLTQQGIEVLVASAGGEWLPLLEDIVPCYHLPLYPSSFPNIFRSIIKLNDLVKREKIDLINTHHRFSGIVCNLYGYLRKIPVVSTVHEIKNDKKFLSRLTIGNSAIVFSQAVKQHLHDVNGLPSDRIIQVPMGVKIQAFRTTSPTLLKKSLGLNDDLPIVACIARISEEKGCDIYIRAIAEVLEAGYHAQFLLVGDGPLRKEIEHLKHNLHLDDYIHITGWREDIYSIIKIVDFLVLPSISEAIGMTILEGFFFGKPTIASRVGGIPEVIQDGKNGLLVPPGDPYKLAQAICNLLNNPQLTSQLGRVGKQQLEDSYSPLAMVNHTLNAYQALSRQT